MKYHVWLVTLKLVTPETRKMHTEFSLKKKIIIKMYCTANSRARVIVSKQKVIHEETEEQESQDPVDWVDVDDDQANVEEPAAHVSEVQSTQRETSMDKVPASPCHRRLSLIS